MFIIKRGDIFLSRQSHHTTRHIIFSREMRMSQCKRYFSALRITMCVDILFWCEMEWQAKVLRVYLWGKNDFSIFYEKKVESNIKLDHGTHVKVWIHSRKLSKFVSKSLHCFIVGTYVRCVSSTIHLLITLQRKAFLLIFMCTTKSVV